jgi:hypothetical protein
MSRPGDIRSAHMDFHHAMTNDACSTMEDHVCSNQTSENHHLVGPELPNGIVILTKTPFAGCLHHRGFASSNCREQQEQSSKGGQ